MRLFPTLAAVAALAAAFPAAADPRQNPTADYSATVVAKSASEPESSSKLWYTKARLRVDVTEEGQAMTVIMDRTAKKMTVYLHASKAFQQEDLPEGESENPIASGTWDVTKLGDETVGGTPTTKWSVNGKGLDGRAFKGMVWTTKENIQLKMEGESDEDGKSVKVSSELRELKVGPVDPKIFDMPKDYKPAPKN